MFLKQYLLKKNITARVFAKKINVSSVTIFRWCNGADIPNAVNMLKIMELTNNKVTANDFYLTDKTNSKKNKNKKQSTGG